MAIASTNNVLRNLDRYQHILAVVIATLIIGGIATLVFVSFGRFILPPIIEISPQRFNPFGGPVCPGSTANRTVTYNINRPGILEIDAVVYDLRKLRPLPETAIATSRPAPYEIRESIPFTFTVPDLAPGRYEWQVGVSPKNQNSQTAWWFIEFEIAENCRPEESSLQR